MIFQSVDVLQHPFKEHDLIQLYKADILGILVETLAAHVQALFPDHTVLVRAYSVRVGTLAEFPRVTPVELLVTHPVLMRVKRGKRQLLFKKIFTFFYLDGRVIVRER